MSNKVNMIDKKSGYVLTGKLKWKTGNDKRVDSYIVEMEDGSDFLFSAKLWDCEEVTESGAL